MAQRLRESDTGTVYDLVTGEDGTQWYIGLKPLTITEKPEFAVVVFHRFSTFRRDLDRQLTVMGIRAAAAFLLAVCGLQLWLNRQVVRPVSLLQKTVRKYAETKEAEGVVRSLSVIRSQNELGALSRDFSALAEEMDRYHRENIQYAEERQRAQTEMDMAARIQAANMPSVFPAFPDRKEFDLFASMTPAKNVGGDFYDFFLMDEDHLALVIADVSGKGVPAALFMMAVRTLIASSARFGGSPAEILRHVNEQVCAENRDNMFVTVWMGVLEISTGRLTCCNAGHEAPVIGKAGGTFARVEDHHHLFIGVTNAVVYRDYELCLSPGDVLFVHTDGVTEATNEKEELFGVERMLSTLNEHASDTPRELLEAVREAALVFTGEAPQFDDLTMLCLRWAG